RHHRRGHIRRRHPAHAAVPDPAVPGGPDGGRDHGGAGAGSAGLDPVTLLPDRVPAVGRLGIAWRRDHRDHQRGAGSGKLSALDGNASSPAMRRGRPRSETRKQAILQAAFELLGERGLAATSMDAVAERAGVSKATIYRWWDSKELLALDALYAA